MRRGMHHDAGRAADPRTPPFILLSCALHLGAAVASCLRPSLWLWAVAVLAADHLLLTAAGLWPRSRLLGPNLRRLPAAAADRGEVAISIDDGPDPAVTPRVLELLAAHDARATFFCIGERVRRHPELARAIVRAGHALENHSERHRHDFALLGPVRMAAEIDAAQRGITDTTGVPPRLFRAPAGLRNPFLQVLLARRGLLLASWTRRGFDTVTGDADLVCRRLLKSLRAGDILLLHDGHAARTPAGVPVILAVLPRLLEALRGAGLHTVVLHAALDAPVKRAREAVN